MSKLQYTNGAKLSPIKGGYACIKPPQSIPRVISSNGKNNIEVIKRYFCSEFLAQLVANHTGMDYDVLIGGEYRLLLEPVAYFTFQGVMIATTATEAAIYDQQLSGGLRKKMVSLTHKNLPLSMFLETADLGFPAWGGAAAQPRRMRILYPAWALELCVSKICPRKSRKSVPLTMSTGPIRR